jgi:acetyltransferase-like isoleucine patch superfamily enzyme
VDIGDDRVTETQVRHEPWFAVWSASGTWPGQTELHADLAERIGAVIGDRVYIAPDAAVICDSLHIGDRSFVAAGCLLRDRVHIGDDCSLNPHVTIAGRVEIGDGARIASHAALFGFNHNFERLDVPIWQQGLTEQGIEIHDDVWIGTHVVVCDGVTVGAHSVVAAGAVVTRDVAPYSVVAGVPARIVRDRRDLVHSPRARDALARFDDVAGAQWREVLERCTSDESHGFLDSPAAPPTVRAHCDAIEIAAAFADVSAAGNTEQWRERLRAMQDPVTGLFPDPAESMPDDPLESRLGREYHHYGVLSVGYALELLDTAPADAVRVVEDLPDAELIERLDGLPWAELAWPAGSWVDFVGTATYLNRRYHDSSKNLEALFGWLQTRVDRRTGMWGEPHDTWGWLMPVNGFYRLTRGTYAQFGEPLPEPEAVIDTVVAHARACGWFVDRARTACNVLDVVHPLCLCARQTDYRRDELRDQAGSLLEDTLRWWIDGEGFAFDENAPTGLQGTEMWLSIVYLLADYLDESAGLSWRPQGVHRLEPAASLHVSL